MALKEGDRVKIKTRKVTEEDTLSQMYYEHMQGLTGTVANYYSKNEVSINIDFDSLGKIPEDVHSVATKRMRKSFRKNSSEEQRKALTKEEIAFTPHYVLLVAESDLEKI